MSPIEQHVFNDLEKTLDCCRYAALQPWCHCVQHSGLGLISLKYVSDTFEEAK